MLKRARDLHFAGQSELADGKLTTAEATFRAALAEYDKILPKPAERWATFHEVARCATHQGKYSDGEHMYRQSLEISMTCYSDDHMSIAITRASLAACLIFQSKARESEALLRRALAVSSQSNDTFVKSIHAAWLALSLQMQKENQEEVKTLLQQATTWLKRVSSPADKARVLSEVGEVLTLRGELATADETLRETLKLQQHHISRNHWRTALTLCRLGECTAVEGKLDDSMKNFQQAVEMMSSDHVKDHPLSGRILLGLGKVLCQREKWREAEGHLKEAVKYLRRALPIPSRTCEAIIELSHCLKMLGKHEESAAILEQPCQHDGSDGKQTKATASFPSTQQQQIDKLLAEVEQLKSEKKTMQQQSAELQQQNAELQQQLQESKKQCESQTARQSELMQQVESQQQRLDHQEQQVHYKQIAIDNLREENTQLTRHKRTLQQAIAAAEHQLKESEEVLIIQQEDIQPGRSLGRGSFGAVAIGFWIGTAVAVKTFYEDLASPRMAQLVKQEVSISNKVNHPNVMSICGVVMKDDIPIQLVMELEQGSLCDVMDAAFASKAYLTLKEQVGLSVGTLAGLTYLHRMSPAPIVHGDIRPTNVLVTTTMEAKIGDLGASHFIGVSLSVGPLSLEYVAPERMPGAGGLSARNTKEADMYSVGITLCELYNGKTGSRKKRPFEILAISHPVLKDVCEQMAEDDPRERASAGVMLKKLEAVQKSHACQSCPPKRLVKGILHGGDNVTLTDTLW